MKGHLRYLAAVALVLGFAASARAGQSFHGAAATKSEYGEPNTE